MLREENLVEASDAKPAPGLGAQHARAPNQKAGLRKLPLRDYLTGHDSPARERALER